MINQTIFIDEFANLIKRSLNSTPHEFLNASNKGEIALMIYINQHDNVTPGELMSALNVGSGRIANALKNLEKKENIIRLKDENDKRKTYIYLTDKGKEIVMSNLDMARKYILSIYEVLGEFDAKNLIRIMKKLVAAKENNNV